MTAATTTIDVSHEPTTAASGALWAPRRTWFDQHGESAATVACVVDHLLGGMHNTAPARALADELTVAWSELPAHVHAGRHLQHRMISRLIRDGVRQFLDIGSGIAHLGATHHVAAARTSDPTTVVYVDVDPVAVRLNEALLDEHPRAHAVLADLCDPASIVNHDTVTGVLDLGQPVGLLLFGVLQHLPGTHVTTVVGRLLDAFVAGSHGAISHLVAEAIPDPRRLVDLYARTPTGLYPHSADDVAACLAGLTLLEPGLVPAQHWQPDPTDPDAPPTPALYAAMARLDHNAARQDPHRAEHRGPEDPHSDRSSV